MSQSLDVMQSSAYCLASTIGGRHTLAPLRVEMSQTRPDSQSESRRHSSPYLRPSGNTQWPMTERGGTWQDQKQERRRKRKRKKGPPGVGWRGKKKKKKTGRKNPWLVLVLDGTFRRVRSLASDVCQANYSYCLRFLFVCGRILCLFVYTLMVMIHQDERQLC